MKIEGIKFKQINVPKEIVNIKDYLDLLGKSLEDLINENKILYNELRKDPFLLKDMDLVVKRLIQAKNNGEHIVVFGDYDVDGVSGTAVLRKGLQYLGFKNVSHIIPTRDTGYSIQRPYIYDYIKETGLKPDLIVTVDCGIKSGYEIDMIYEELGIDVIVTDHHLPEKNGYKSKHCIAMVDPHRPDSEYPFKEMSGSFVALKVIEALNKELPFIFGPKDLKNENGNPQFAINELQEIAILGIVADMMPIIGENKILVKEALPRYIFSKNKRIQTFTKNLINTNYDDPKNINPDLIGWQIGPRINAAKRIQNSTIPIDMLLSDDQDKINAWYIELNNINNERKDVVLNEKLEAINFGLKKKSDGYKGVCYIKPEISDGIIGLIAGQIKEEVYLPSIVIGGYNKEKQILKGSCRSIEGFHILNILDELKEYLDGYGGHALAAGFSIKQENVNSFAENFYKLCDKYISNETLLRKKHTFGYIKDYSIINQNFINILNISAPYGIGNEEPEFVVLGEIKYINYIGNNNQHVKITIKNDKNEMVAGVAFNYEKNFSNLHDFIDGKIGKKIGLIGKLQLNEYNGNITKQVIITDISFL